MTEQPRLTTVMGVARAVLASVDPRDGARVLTAEFGWDATFHALALLRGDAARAAFGEVWSALATGDLAAQIDAVRVGPVPPGAIGPDTR